MAFSPPTAALFFSLQPGVVYSLPGRGQLRGELEWVRVTVAPAGRVIPYEVAEGNQPGTTLRWNVALDYRLSENMRGSLGYSGRSEPMRPEVLHVAKAEVRAFF